MQMYAQIIKLIKKKIHVLKGIQLIQISSQNKNKGAIVTKYARLRKL
jgi:hypothetical protein